MYYIELVQNRVRGAVAWMPPSPSVSHAQEEPKEEFGEPEPSPAIEVIRPRAPAWDFGEYCV
jgi:hypothetical protein